MTDSFVSRHNGPNAADRDAMLASIGFDSLDAMTQAIVPESILNTRDMALPPALSEEDALDELRTIASKNKVLRSMIGLGYHGNHTPQVILRNVLLNPAWYTAYTPYQPEISQGRLEVLFNFQTLVTELTGLDIANASLLDEATAAAEAMALAHRSGRGKKHIFLVSTGVHGQTIDVLHTRAKPMGIKVQLCDDLDGASLDDVFGVLVQYPDTRGHVADFSEFSAKLHANKSLLIMAADPLALALLDSPASMGADIAIGSMQRFGVPMFGGGPHAAYMATKDALKRSLPGRLVGQSVDVAGKPAYRLALQTREQHIRRDKATSNICTAQALLAMIAALYACYHGPAGLKRIAGEVSGLARGFANALAGAGVEVHSQQLFDTVSFKPADVDAALAALEAAGYNLRDLGDGWLSASFDETHKVADVDAVLAVVAPGATATCEAVDSQRDNHLMSQACFHDYHTETEMMRYLRRMADRDLALDRAMIPLGSCTMKLNAAAEMAPVTWPEFANMHPLAPRSQLDGTFELVEQLSAMLCECTGYDGMSLQPNAGSQGEYAGLLAIRAYHDARGDTERTICLIPSSAHGTNPASAQMAGMKVVVVDCDDLGNVDMDDLSAKIDKHAAQLAAIMITYPSTHGVFEEQVVALCDKVHTAGGMVYIDGANMNALVGVAQPGQFGGDVSHLNLHKTFCIPHGGGGPGVGPIGVGKCLEPFLPGHNALGNTDNVVAAAPFGSAGILPISWMYLRMMGPQGLRLATQQALLSANYIATRLGERYEVLYKGRNGLVAHECILDVRPLKDAHGVTVDDIAKRLIDYGFHAPTMSFPVAGTLMIEPTESESKAEIDRFIDAMNGIMDEVDAIAAGTYSHADSPLAHAPHTLDDLVGDWQRPYSRALGATPAKVEQKYWPAVGRVDNVYGDKNLVCSCAPIDAYRDA